jgi:hypothetical protein
VADSQSQAPQSETALSASAEIASARVALRCLDKASRAVRTYGFGNAVTLRFIQQLTAALEAHLAAWGVLGVIIEASEFRLGEEVVWHSEDSVGEGLSFRLYGDGVRELRFHHGLGEQDLRRFLEALWDKSASSEDDDVVTRLWARDFATISFVTAEDIIKAPAVTGPPDPLEGSYFSLPPDSFKGVVEREQVRAAAGNAVGLSPAGVPAAGVNLKPSGKRAQEVVGFELTEPEREGLAAELAAENELDGTGYVLRALRAILISERSPDLLTRVLVLVPSLFDALLATGRWHEVHEVLTLLDEGPSNPAFEPTHLALAKRALDALSAPSRVALIAAGLNAFPERSPDGLGDVLARLLPPAVGPLCAALQSVQAREHRWVVREALADLGKSNQEPVLQGLAGPDAETVRDLIDVILSWGQGPAAEVLSMLSDHPNRDVRRDALAAIAALRPQGDGAALVAFASDGDRAVRLQVLRLLMAGQHQAPWEAWELHTRFEAVAELPGGDRRALLLAMRATSGAAMVPFLVGLLAERPPAQKQKAEQVALAAVDALALFGTPEARAALEAGRSGQDPALQKVCAEALARLARRQAGKEA